MSEAEQIKAKLDKLNAVVISQDSAKVIVAYRQKDKTKLARFDLKGYYYDRYGPNVLATFNGSRFWFQSGAIADSVSDEQLEEIKKVHSGESALSTFDPTILGDLRS